MKLKFIDPSSLDKNLKATIHRSGKLGFTIEAAKKLKLTETKSASIAINEDDPNDKNIYVVVHETIEGSAFKINKAGDYFYVNTKALFDDMKIDYINHSVVYDISSEVIDGHDVYKFKRRMPKSGHQKISPLNLSLDSQ